MRKFRARYLSARDVLAGTALLLLIGCMPVTSGQQAQGVAQKKLAEYSRRNQVPLSEFALLETRSGSDYPWRFTWRTATNPQHTVVVFVDYSGRTEVSRLIEEPRADSP